MTNITTSVANSDGFIPSIWAQEALPILRNNINLAKFVSKDSDWGENAFATVGQTLNICYAGVFGAPQDGTSTPYTAQVPTGGTSTAVTLSKYKIQPFLISDVAQAQSNQDLMQRILEPAIVSLAEQVENDLFSMTQSFSAASIGTIGTDMTSAVVRSAQKSLNIAKAPVNDRYLVMSPKDLAALEADSTLANYFNFNPDNGVVEDGSFGRKLYGFVPVMSQLVPATAGSGHAVQTLTISGSPTGGSFTLTYSGQTTAAIAYNASAAAVESAIQALSNIGTGMARVSGGPGPSSAWTVVLYVASPVAFTHTDSFTGGTTPALAVADSTTVATSNVALHKNALILASRPVRPRGGSTVMSSQIHDDVSGLVINLAAQENLQYGGLWVNASILYGVAALRPDQGAVILA